MSERQYSEEEVEAILRHAAKTSSTGVSRDRLVKMAEELGISPEDLARSESTVLAQRQFEEDRLAYRRFKRREFYNSLAVYVVVNLGLVGFDVAKDHVLNWAIYPILGWGIGIASSFIKTFFQSPAEELEAVKKWNTEIAYTNLPEDQQRVLDRLAETPMLRVQAVQDLRDECGLDLKEAAERVDAYLALHPGKFS